jgi:uncharacterized protein (DUF342 family)
MMDDYGNHMDGPEEERTKRREALSALSAERWMWRETMQELKKAKDDYVELSKKWNVARGERPTQAEQREIVQAKYRLFGGIDQLAER